MVKFEGKIGTLYQIFTSRFLKNSPHDVQTKGGGVKGLLNNVKKTALFLKDGFPNTEGKNVNGADIWHIKHKPRQRQLL